MSNDDLERLLAELRETLKKSDGEASPYIFNAEEVQWFKRTMRMVSTDEQARHLRRAIAMAESLTDKQIEFLPLFLDGGLFGRRLLRFGFWALVSLGIVLSNLDRILQWAGFRGPQ